MGAMLRIDRIRRSDLFPCCPAPAAPVPAADPVPAVPVPVRVPATDETMLGYGH